MSHDESIKVRFHAPPGDLDGHFTTFYLTEFRFPPGVVVKDSLQPEWANLRFFDGSRPESWIDRGGHVANARFTATGPSSRCVNFVLGSSRMWGIGLLPRGWARFVREPANHYANLIADGHRHPVFARFAPLADSLFGNEPDEEAELARIVAFFRELDAPKSADDEAILAIHAALVDGEVTTVRGLVEQLGICQRTLERMCHRHFGFSPKLLMRRQRIMRSLAQFMLDPSLKWIGAIDSQYHDQAQFVRDFHEFFGMTPSDYASMPHPVLARFMIERARAHGAPVQTMDRPHGNSAKG